MRGMTRRAVAGSNRFMDGLTGEFGFFMAGQAEIGASGLEHVFMIGLVRIMTTQALPLCNRLVGKQAAKPAFIVARVTESRPLLFQLKPVIALVRIMAIETVTGGNGGVHVFFGILALMTFSTQPGFSIVRQQESLFLEFGMFLSRRFMA